MSHAARTVLITEIVLLLAAVVIGELAGHRPFADLRFTAGAFLAGFIGVLPGGLLVAWSLSSRRRFFVQLREQSWSRVGQRFADCAAWELVLISASAGIAEEALLRGVVQQVIGHSVHPAAGLIIGGILFAGLHWVSIRYAVLAGLLGVWWGVLYLLTGSILAAILAHFLHDLVAFGLGRRVWDAR